MVYVKFLVGQIVVTPVIGPGCAGGPVTAVTARIDAVLVPQELLAVTVIFPLAAVPDVDTVIEFVLAPEVMLHPAGNVHA